MGKKVTERLPTDHIFWPKWQIKFSNNTVYPTEFSGVHLGTLAEKQASNDTHEPNPRKKRFFPPLDMLFIDSYVFEYYERPDVEIGFEAGGGVPGTLKVVEKVAINASSLSHSKEKDGIWLKKLRFILQNFPKVRAITVLTSVVLDMASPVSLPEPIYFMDVANTSVRDRMRHGILTGEELRMLPNNPETLRPSDFAMQEWDNLPKEWPMFGKRKANGTAPELHMGTMVFFAKEWVSLDGIGAPGRLCSLGSRSADPMGAIVRKEKDKAAQMAQADITRKEKDKTIQVAQADTREPDKNLKKKPSKFSLRHKGSGLSLLRQASTFSMRSQPSKGSLKRQKTWA
ncbi:hypothetical protein SLS64_013849 [Diaporthe eres]|uniref:Uncharacterized protein n=1 Tax=Diaporthe eres TaxID=83184 RepID=A0ABR1NW44_DIAER